jgi:hypothetical protein
MTILSVTHHVEPLLEFGYGQSLDDPKHGLFMFGPLEERKPTSMRIGVVGTPAGIDLYKGWIKAITGFVPAARPEALHQLGFPGFEAVFRTAWPIQPVAELPISTTDISKALRVSDRHVGIFEAVSLFEGAIRRKIRQDDVSVDVWFVIIPEEVYILGRPQSRIPFAERERIERRIDARIARRLRSQPSLFAEDMEEAKIYAYDLDFHNQLKARLLETKAVVQIVRESSLEPQGLFSRNSRRLQDPATLAWNLATTSYFKAGGRPWKLHAVREGVCYIGMVFKKDAQDPSGMSACCGAQMFLNSGDGLVFKGAIGKRQPERHEFHLSKDDAADLMKSVLDEYVAENGQPPREVFLHAKTRFSNDEWDGFNSVLPAGVKVVGVRITRSSDVKMFRDGRTPVLRGTALHLDDRLAYLWSSGFVAALNTYAGREVPNPLAVEITRGEADIAQVCEDVLGLTKVNFNACIYGDGLPVTLRFADSVGEILTAGPVGDLPPLPFRHYI